MYKDSAIDEKFVSRIWDSGRFARNALRAKDGRKIEIIHHGQLNDDSGADFQNAKIKIGGQIHKGDVEIHVKNSHWRAHRHNVNPRYNSAILHVVMWDDSSNLLTRKQNGKRIPTLVLCDYLTSSIGKLWKALESGEKKPTPCRKAETMTLEAIGAVLDRAGMDRFLQKTQIFEERMVGKNCDQLLYEGTMEALGYSRNKEPFRELAQSAPLEILIGQPPEKIQAILLGVAGLLPSRNGKRAVFDEETKEYVDRTEALWKPFFSQFEGKLMSGDQWKFFRMRQGNLPTIRIAGMSHVLSNCKTSLLATFLPSFSDGNASKKLHDILSSRASGYWTRHYTFGGKPHKEMPFLIGRNRAADIVINAILPATLAHARQSESRKLQQSATMAYSSHRKLQDNKLTRYVASRIFRDRAECLSAINSAMRQQGLIHLYKNFCAVRDCQNCPLT